MGAYLTLLCPEPFCDTELQHQDVKRIEHHAKLTPKVPQIVTTEQIQHPSTFV